ncbi:MAG TPA: UvrB/UvrC motif-containing protein [Spirochaetota bacterium]|nr:UvrB/UvrC motif-containing protein [Spirochaetota bacterium]
MFCEKCKHNEATVHLTEIIKNVKSEVHLCESCAREIGLNSKLANFNLTVPDMLSFLDVEEAGGMVDPNRCRGCGFTFLDYKKTGKLGCPECYRYLRSTLDPVVVNYHGEKRHVGKMPLNYIEMKTPVRVLFDKSVNVAEKTDVLSDLMKKLDKAVEEERYEEAAVLRDKIRDSETAQ